METKLEKTYRGSIVAFGCVALFSTVSSCQRFTKLLIRNVSYEVLLILFLHLSSKRSSTMPFRYKCTFCFRYSSVPQSACCSGGLSVKWVLELCCACLYMACHVYVFPALHPCNCVDRNYIRLIAAQFGLV